MREIDVQPLLAGALRALAVGASDEFGRLVAELSRPVPDAWRLAVDRAISVRLQDAVAVAWERGWQPADVVRHVVRGRGERHARLATDAIAAQVRAYSAATLDDTWHDQLASLDARVWWDADDDHLPAWRERENVRPEAFLTCAIELINLLDALPRLAHIGPLPGTPRSGAPASDRTREVDRRMLGKVRALLAKAESTEFPEEAEALSARAQELMARHSIDHALLASGSGTSVGEPAGRRVAVPDPYQTPKAVLLTVVAEANRCRAVWHRELGFSTVLGFPADLAAVEMLFTSLLVQATSAMVHAGSRRDSLGTSRTRSFRHAFLGAYAARIGERLRETTSRVAAETGGKDLLPVLAARDLAVERVVDRMFPELTRGRARTVSNREGWIAGRAAADLASLNGRSEVTGDARG